MEGQRSLRQQAKFSQRILCGSGRIHPTIYLKLRLHTATSQHNHLIHGKDLDK